MMAASSPLVAKAVELLLEMGKREAGESVGEMCERLAKPLNDRAKAENAAMAEKSAREAKK